MEASTFDERADAASRGFNGWGSSNRGWARVITAAGETRTYRASSQHGAAHTEEELLEQVFGAFPDIQQNRPDPNVAGVNRLVELYTERQPCTDGNAEVQRRQRVNTRRNCHAYLTAAVHDNVRVIYSVPNSEPAHNALVADARAAYIDEIARGLRRFTLAEAMNNNVRFYQVPIRQRSYVVNGGNWGRDYEGDYAHYNALREGLERNYGWFLAEFGIDIRTPLRQAFEAGAHAAGSAPVRAAMTAVAEQISREVDTVLAIKGSKGGSQDKGPPPPPPPPSSGAGGFGKGPFVGATAPAVPLVWG